MEKYNYRCVPFMASIKGGMFSKDNADTIAKQLESVIGSHSTEGWEFYGIYQVQTFVKSGCLQSLFGGGNDDVIPHDIVVFRAPK